MKSAGRRTGGFTSRRANKGCFMALRYRLIPLVILVHSVCEGADKEIERLQRHLALVEDNVRTRSVDERMGAVMALLRQTLARVNEVHTANAVMQTTFTAFSAKLVRLPELGRGEACGVRPQTPQVIHDQDKRMHGKQSTLFSSSSYSIHRSNSAEWQTSIQTRDIESQRLGLQLKLPLCGHSGVAAWLTGGPLLSVRVPAAHATDFGNNNSEGHS